MGNNLRARLGPPQYGGQGLTLHHGLNGTEAKDSLETIATFSHSITWGFGGILQRPLWLDLEDLSLSLSLSALWNPYGDSTGPVTALLGWHLPPSALLERR